MKILVFILKIALSVLIIGCVIYYEQTLFTGFGILACTFIVLISYILPNKIADVLKEMEGYFIIIGLCLYFITFIHLGIGLRVIHKDNQVRVVSAFYPFGKSFGIGEQIDTLKHIPCCYEQDKEFCVRYDDIFMLKEGKRNKLFNKHEVIAYGTDFKFREKDFGHGKLYICSFIDTTGVRYEVDMYGKVIDKLYKPRVIDTSTDYFPTIY